MPVPHQELCSSGGQRFPSAQERGALSRESFPHYAYMPLTDEEFEKLAAEAIQGLPPEFRDKLDNVIVTVQKAPSKAQERRFGPGLLGLYEGVPLPDRGQFYSGAMPDKITLFKDNLESGCRGAGQLVRRVSHTLMHEIAHHFGMDDEELLRKGLY